MPLTKQLCAGRCESEAPINTVDSGPIHLISFEKGRSSPTQIIFLYIISQEIGRRFSLVVDICSLKLYLLERYQILSSFQLMNVISFVLQTHYFFHYFLVKKRLINYLLYMKLKSHYLYGFMFTIRAKCFKEV